MCKRSVWSGLVSLLETMDSRNIGKCEMMNFFMLILIFFHLHVKSIFLSS